MHIMFSQPARLGLVVPYGTSVLYAMGRRAALLTAVAVLHLIAFLLLSTSLRIVSPPVKEGELRMIVFNPELPPRTAPAPPTASMFKAPDEPDVAAPDIAISPAPGIGTGSSTNEVQSRIAPILDPAHANERPELPGTLGALIAALSLKLRLLVLPDGSIFSAHVVRSTGEAEIDRVAIQWVQANWRYLPAVVNGRPIMGRVTVIVRFAPIH
jgi:protein TonB